MGEKDTSAILHNYFYSVWVLFFLAQSLRSRGRPLPGRRRRRARGHERLALRRGARGDERARQDPLRARGPGRQNEILPILSLPNLKFLKIIAKKYV